MDENTQKLIDDANEFVSCLLGMKEENFREYKDLFKVIRDYIVANSALLRKGYEAVDQLPREEREKMYKEHESELNWSVVGIDCKSAVDYLIDGAVRRQSFHPEYDVDFMPPYTYVDLQDVRRVMHYAKYLINTSDDSVAMHPVKNHLPERFRNC